MIDLEPRAKPTVPSRSFVEKETQWEYLRIAVFVAVLFFIFFEPNPTSRTWAEGGMTGEVEGSIFQQLLWPVLLIFAVLSVGYRWPATFRQFDASFLVVLGWFFVSSLLAVNPSISIRRFAFMAIVMLLILVAMGSFYRKESSIKCILLIIGFATFYSYLYVAFFPFYGLHQATGLEPQLVGNWRGQYAHKNIAGAVYAMALNADLRLDYTAFRMLAPLHFIFLLFTHDKTATYLFIPIYFLSSFVVRMRSSYSIILTVISPLFIANFITVGSMYFDPAKTLATKIVGDSTYTGRTELWQLLVNYTWLHPWHGAGFQSFWQVGTDSPAFFAGGLWTMKAFYGHQAFLDIAATTGIPGLLAALWFAVVRPAVDIGKIRNRRNPALAFYISIWLLPLYQGVTESDLFDRAGGTWVIMLLAVAGIRCLRVHEDEDERTLRCGANARQGPRPADIAYHGQRRQSSN